MKCYLHAPGTCDYKPHSHEKQEKKKNTKKSSDAWLPPQQTTWLTWSTWSRPDRLSRSSGSYIDRSIGRPIRERGCPIFIFILFYSSSSCCCWEVVLYWVRWGVFLFFLKIGCNRECGLRPRRPGFRDRRPTGGEGGGERRWGLLGMPMDDPRRPIIHPRSTDHRLNLAPVMLRKCGWSLSAPSDFSLDAWSLKSIISPTTLFLLPNPRFLLPLPACKWALFRSNIWNKKSRNDFLQPQGTIRL